MNFLNLVLALGAIVTALAVSLVCLLGVVVWLAGGPWAHRE